MEGPVLNLDQEDFVGVRLSRSFIIPDLSFFLGDSLACVVEIGQLSRPDKLFLWEKYLPHVQVIWIPKIGRYSLKALINQGDGASIARAVDGGMEVSVQSLQRFLIPNGFVPDLRSNLADEDKHQ